MKTRIISGLIMLPLIIVLYFRGIPLAVVAFIISALAIREVFKAFEKIDVYPNLFFSWGALVVLYAIHFLFPGNLAFVTFWLAGTVVAAFIAFFAVTKHKAVDLSATVFGTVYIGFLVYHIVMIDETGYGVMVWLVAITAICTDIFAYFIGMFFGHRKLAPTLSPKKTVEGALGGILGSVFGSMVFFVIVHVGSVPHILLMGILGSIMAQLGDLSASLIKRQIGIKDYGHILPGHGGIMDRFDSIIFTAPTIYYYLVLVMPEMGS